MSSAGPEPDYPLHDLTRVVSRSGTVSFDGPGRGYVLAKALAGERIGICDVEDDRWLVSFATLDLGFIDLTTTTFEPALTFEIPVVS